jgi:anti-sigma-K factor RskA
VTLPEPDDLLAAEMALGVLDGDERAAARTRVGADAAFAAAVSAWAERLAPWLDDVAAVEPPSTTLAALLRRITLQQPANDALPALQRKVNVWRGATGVATALAASLALALLLRPETTTMPRPAPAPTNAVPRAAPLVALLAQGKAAPTLLASYDPEAHQLVLAAPAPLSPGLRHDHELWVIPASGKPVSLGVLPAGTRSHKELPTSLARLLVPGATLAVTVEQTGGSPTGQPSGAPIAAGALDQA